MLRTMRVVAASLGLLCGMGGCTSFLTGDKLSTDPNNPGSATVQTLLVGMQSAQFSLHEGTVAMMMCEWVQACGATNGRFVQGLGLYDFGASANTGANFIDWQLIYTAGGLIDIHTIERDARAAGDSVYLGIGKVWEAFTIGTAADMWGSIPFTQITTSATPDTDPQFAVYDSVQSLLRQAIGELTNGTATLTPPPDLVFGRFGDAPGGDGLASWIKTAYTLRARYWLHVEEAAAAGRLPSGLTAIQVYDSAIAAASNGIDDPTGQHDFRSAHFAPTSQQNMWSQFQSNSGFGGDLEAGKVLVDIMNARSDPRRPLYFCTNAGGGYGGDSFNPPAVTPDSVSNFACLPPRFGATVGTPYVSYAENQLILAEAYHGTGDDANALLHLNNERAVPGSASDTTLPALPTLVAITGAALLDSIMIEKYVVMFQNIETIMDYRRTCIPAITPVQSNFLNITAVPGELFYPQTERNVNAAHIPTESQELANGLRTEADVNVCP